MCPDFQSFYEPFCWDSSFNSDRHTVRVLAVGLLSDAVFEIVEIVELGIVDKMLSLEFCDWIIGGADLF